MLVNKWPNKLLQHVLPGRCLLCASPADGRTPLCTACVNDLPAIGSACVRCGVPLPVPLVCGACLRAPPVWDSAVAVWSYAAAITWLVHRFKFQGSLVHGKVLAHGLADRLSEGAKHADVIVPVPLHRARLRQRGFNQALELARPVGRRLGVPVDPSVVKRVVRTVEQSSLVAHERRGNVRGAFTVRADVRGLSVALVDDVMTTGHTVGELARALRRAGAEAVHVWVCARALPPRATSSGKTISQ